MNKPSFSLSDFRTWLQKQSINKNGNELPVLEQRVESRLGSERLLQQIKKHNRLKNAKFITEQFKITGGKKIKEEDGFIIIEVNNVFLKLPKEYVRYK